MCLHGYQVEKIEARDIDGKELLQRVQTCEGKLEEFTASRLSPFNQQDIISRLEQLEQQAGTQRLAAAAEGEAEVAKAAEATAGDEEITAEGHASPKVKMMGSFHTYMRLLPLLWGPG